MDDADEDLQSAAIGLAGHAVGCFLEGLEFSLISLDDGYGSGPFIDVSEPCFPSEGKQWSCNDLFQAEATVRALLSGPAAIEKFSFGSCSRHLTITNDLLEDFDLWRAIDIAGAMPSSGPVLPRLWHQVARTTNRLHVWDAIKCLSVVLAQVPELNGHEALSVIIQALRGELCDLGLLRRTL